MTNIVIIESPLRGDDHEYREFERNRRYLAALLRDSILNKRESPIAPHGYYTMRGALDDSDQHERQAGFESSEEFYKIAGLVVVGVDLGISDGMKTGIERAIYYNVRIEERSLPDWSGRYRIEHTANNDWWIRTRREMFRDKLRSID